MAEEEQKKKGKDWTEEELKDCKKRGDEHEWEWVWNEEGKWTPFRRCMNCDTVEPCGV